MTLRLISWNVNKRRAIDRQIEALRERQPDLIALQEVTAKNLEAARHACAAIGLAHAVDSRSGTEVSRRGYVVIASRWPLQRSQHDISIYPPPCVESIVTAHVKSPSGLIEIHTVHVPTSGGGNTLGLYCAVLEDLYARLSRPCAHHRILCGDFNSPQRELPEGVLITFGERIGKDGRAYIRRGRERQAAAERGVLAGLSAYDLHDVYRSVNGYTPQESSWVARNRGREFGFRLDHILASRSLNPVECRYLHPLRHDSLSDHSAIEAVFSP